MAGQTGSYGASRVSLSYRPEIDGLRAVAVLFVLWFHAGLPGLPGGFIGVDVFFVISGYLITSIIHREAQDGRFSFAFFYQRRFRRIAPALVTVTAATLVVGYVLLLSHELDELGRSAFATVAMVSNIYFWRSANYFDSAGGIVPLLHSWSLGVEEQFYLLFPGALVFAERFGRPRLAVLGLGLCSLVLCLLMTAPAPAASFYLLPSRGWELMTGAALALRMVSVPAGAKQVAGFVGAALIVAAAALISPSDPFPGWRALLPIVGTALVIASGGRSSAGRALSWRPFVYVGRISYSLYLWHWPVLVFLRQWRADLQLPMAWAIGSLAIAFVLAAASYHWIERPARKPSTPFRKVLVPTLVTAAAALAASGAVIISKGLPQRLPTNVDAIASGRNAYAPLAHACTDMGFEYAMAHCRIGPAGPPEVLLWGDSHAAAISEAVAKATERPGLVISMGECPPVPSWPKGWNPAECKVTNTRTLSFAENDPDIRTVVLSARWTQMNEEGGLHFWRTLQEVVDRLDAAGKRVIAVAGIPDPGVDVPWASAVRARFGRAPLQLRCPTAHLPLKGVTLVDVSAQFCRKPAYLLFSDSNHPSRYAGLEIIAPALRAAEGVVEKGRRVIRPVPASSSGKNPS